MSEEKPTLILEPLPLSDPEWSRIASLISKTYRNSCIVRIEKVNSVGTDNYIDRLNEVGTDSEVCEMFHGTKEKYVRPILIEGLCASHNVTSAYGKGTYFSPFPEFAMSYTDVGKVTNLNFVFLCDVIKKDTGGNKTNIYVCPRDDSFNIKYLIRFYIDADGGETITRGIPLKMKGPSAKLAAKWGQ